MDSVNEQQGTLGTHMPSPEESLATANDTQGALPDTEKNEMQGNQEDESGGMGAHDDVDTAAPLAEDIGDADEVSGEEIDDPNATSAAAEPEQSVPSAVVKTVIRSSLTNSEILHTFPMQHVIDTTTPAFRMLESYYKDILPGGTSLREYASMLTDNYVHSKGTIMADTDTLGSEVLLPRGNSRPLAFEVMWMIIKEILPARQLVQVHVHRLDDNGIALSSTHQMSSILRGFPDHFASFQKHYNVVLHTKYGGTDGKSKNEIRLSSNDFVLIRHLYLARHLDVKEFRIPGIRKLVLDLNFFGTSSRRAEHVAFILNAFPDLECLYLYRFGPHRADIEPHEFLCSGFPLDMVSALAQCPEPGPDVSYPTKLYQRTMQHFIDAKNKVITEASEAMAKAEKVYDIPAKSVAKGKLEFASRFQIAYVAFEVAGIKEWSQRRYEEAKRDLFNTRPLRG